MPGRLVLTIRALRESNIIEDSAWVDPALPAAQDQLRAGDLEAGRRLLEAVRDDHELRALRVAHLAHLAIAKVGELATLAAERPQDPDLALWLGATRIQQAWEVRGGARASQVGRERFEQFWQILGGAYDPLMRAAELLPQDPTPWNNLQWRGLGLQVGRAELDDVWLELRKRSPVHYVGHYSRVQVLCEKWSGSNDEVLDFVTTVADTAPPGEPLGALLVAAHLEVMSEMDVDPQRYFAAPTIRDQLVRHSDAWMAAIKPHVRTPEAHHLFGAGLFLAGERDRARRHLAEVSAKSVPRTLPWSYLFYTSKLHYRGVRKALGLK